VVRSIQQGLPGARPFVQDVQFKVSGMGRGNDGKVVFVPSDR
jgi:hypothetical protein